MASAPVLTYINDYGARMPLIFRCEGNTCKVDEDQRARLITGEAT
ncbi:periplasmic pilus exported chaperone [Escherichia coli]|uniref:Periplasmic pilus exported chaperone n=1 Tax=Escherichia coli TaxID=562 RepID=A0A376W6Z4_ECOLX|nr:periplasmic pilus exported chaperone [Escherichia coli]